MAASTRKTPNSRVYLSQIKEICTRRAVIVHLSLGHVEVRNGGVRMRRGRVQVRQGRIDVRCLGFSRTRTQPWGKWSRLLRTWPRAAAGILPQMDAASAHMVAASTHRIASAVVSEVSAVKHSAYHRYQPSNVSRAKGITRRLNARVSSRQLLGRGTSELSAVNSLHTTN